MVTSLLYQLLCQPSQPMAFFYRTRCVSTRTAISSEAEGRRVLRGTFTNEVYGPSASNNTNHNKSQQPKQCTNQTIIAQFEIPIMSPTCLVAHHFWHVIENFILLHVILLFLNIDVYTHRQCWKEMSIVSTKFIVKFCFEFLLGKAPGGQSSQPATWWLWWSTWTQQVDISDTVCWKCSINRVCFMFFDFERDYDRPWHFCCFSFVASWNSSRHKRKDGEPLQRRATLFAAAATSRVFGQPGRNRQKLAETETSKPGMDVRPSRAGTRTCGTNW